VNSPSTTQTVASALAQAKSAGIDRLDAQLLLGHVLARSRSWLVAHDDAPLGAEQTETLRHLFDRRLAGEPVAYLVGEKEFHGLAFHVDANVLVPRPDTEVLVDWAIELLGTAWPGLPMPAVVDLGTGSGAIAISVKHARPAAAVLATDLSQPALAVARANAGRLGVAVDFRASNWWSALDDRRFELVLSNPPYIAGGDTHLPALRHEPTLALTPGGDGLDAIRAIIAGASTHLAASGWLLLEHGYDQAEAVQSLLRAHGFIHIETRRDLGGQCRCTGGSFRRTA
jgi:release factor glutamine methyltransferase